VKQVLANVSQPGVSAHVSPPSRLYCSTHPSVNLKETGTQLPAVPARSISSVAAVKTAASALGSPVAHVVGCTSCIMEPTT
jgi:hypothetical protein